MILQLEVPVTEPTMMIVSWHDPVVDAVGFDARSMYVELFWLNVLGPTATWLLRRLVAGLDRYPLGYELDLDDTAGALGLGYTLGTTNPFIRAMNRCVLFGVAQPYDGGLAVRRRVPPVAGRHLTRMPESSAPCTASGPAAPRPIAPCRTRSAPASSQRRWPRSATTPTRSNAS